MLIGGFLHLLLLIAHALGMCNDETMCGRCMFATSCFVPGVLHYCFELFQSMKDSKNNCIFWMYRVIQLW